ncbi:MAG TPA: Arm DNA-binding domain-containing protein, partial [Candidatus Hydrogenedentes bacterium]|nr:Arm DNA-binding domain-containing protein [Candidatus Hydrogenedentota bacterium]
MRERLTAALVKGLAPGERLVEVCDTEVPGLSVVVSPGGSKTFFFRYRERESRSMRRYKIGRADVLTVYQARARAQELRAEVAAGSDPQQERAATRAGCLEDYLDGPYTERVAHLKSHDAIIATLRRDFAEFLNQPLSAITTWKLEKWRRA